MRTPEMTLLHMPGEANSLICELSEPIPAVLRDRFLRRVRGLLSGDDILSPAKIVAACARAQHELMIAPEIRRAGAGRR
jgi:hypothetical protein